MLNPGEETFSALVVSYVPLLTGEAGSLVDSEDLAGLVDQLPSGGADACIWLMRDHQPIPVFVMENANDIIDHLVAWSEEKPIEWFSLKIMDRDGKYAIALIPNLEKSVERWRMAYHLRVGYPVPTNAHFNIFFRTINFVSGGKTSYHSVKDMIGPETQVGFIDLKDVDRNDPSKIDYQKIRCLGPFPINRGINIDQYMESIIDNANEITTG
jgi:hypothetical protein